MGLLNVLQKYIDIKSREARLLGERSVPLLARN